MTENNQKPIFIVGCERSGTTLIRLILHSHPNIALPPQTKFLKKIYKRRLLWRNLANEANRIKLGHWFVDNFEKRTKLPDLGLEIGAIHKEIISSATSLGAAASGVFRLYSRKFDKPRWGDKRPYYIKYLKQLLALFPDAQIIHVVRDGRDCIASLLKMRWWKEDLVYSIFNWQEAIRKGKQASRVLSEEQFIEIRYEDFITHPEKWTRELCRFLGEKYHKEMLQFQETAEIAVPDYKMPWHSATRGPISSTAVGRWQKDLEKWQVRLIENVAGQELKEWGYEFSSVNTIIPLGERLKYYKGLVEYRLNGWFISGLDRFISLFYPWPLSNQIDRTSDT